MIEIEKIYDKKGNVVDKLCKSGDKYCSHNHQICGCYVFNGNPKHSLNFG